MNHEPPLIQVADHRHSGTLCPVCNAEIVTADRIVVCPDCGAAHHETCWKKDGCAAYACASSRQDLNQVTPAIVIGHDDLDRATSPRMVSAVARLHSPTMPGQTAPSLPHAIRQPMSRFAVVAFLVSLLGIPLLGIMAFGVSLSDSVPAHFLIVVFGIVAVLLGAIAIGHIQVKRRRGTLFAVCGVFLGLGDMVGWILVVAMLTDLRGGNTVADVQFSNQAPDLATIAVMPEILQRAMRANVVVTANNGWNPLGQALGSGVIVRIDRARAYILTNRHVIDSGYRENSGSDHVPKETKVEVEMLGQSPREAAIHWVAPYGIDVALISTDILTDEANMTKWKDENQVQVGSDVFGVGNPCELSWTQTRGSVSQIRKQTIRGHEISVIQTDVPISSGNSGGGLYDEQGFLIGINTWTTNKNIAEGLSFAISMESILELGPPIPEENEEK